jgi:hypothetical protein
VAITWVNQYNSGAGVADIIRLFGGFSFKDNGKRISLPVKYNSDPLAKALSLLNYSENLTCYKIGSISGLLKLNADPTRPDDPGAEPRGETMKFKARRDGELVEDDLSFHIPGFLASTGDDVQTAGEYIAASILTESGVVAVRFVGTAGQSRR